VLENTAMTTKKQDTPPPKSVRAKQVAALLGVASSTVWVWAKRPDFPRARKLGPQTTIWDRDEVLAWRDAQMQA
jgi:predicted DNA-binding transcriptional regulator AlpA